MRRAIDVVVATTALVVSSPVIVLIGVLVWWRLGRPVLFRQVRVGRHNKEFRIVKFRTMRSERWPGEPDADRDTGLGRRLRAISADELPQLWNVLVGDMSLIGPRPTLPDQVRHYSARQRRRLELRPGLTGWAQVNGRNSISWPQRIELDLEYVDRRGLGMDARIVWRTVRMLVQPTGIYGTGGVNPGFPIPDTAIPPSTSADASTTAGKSRT
ncbi:MAG: sugar transferase [Propionibacteriales bacterium]|nr:sugar transferase [Propionibacteriales bacterium]